MFKNFSIHFVCRVMTVGFIALEVSLVSFSRHGLRSPDVGVIVLMACLLLLMSPGHNENLAPSLIAVMSESLTLAVMTVFCGSLLPVAWVCIAGYAVFLLCRGLSRYAGLETLFDVSQIWTGFEKDTSSLYALLVMFVMFGISIFPSCGVLAVCIAVPLYIILYYRAYSGHSMFLSFKRESLLKEMILRSEANGSGNFAENRALRSCYERLLSVMETQKPYLDPNLDRDKLASLCATNRTYISKAINKCTGLYVPSFINSFRIRMAGEMIRENPYLPVNVVMSECGFKTMSAFDFAFKNEFKTTPKDYAQRLIVERGMLTGEGQ